MITVETLVMVYGMAIGVPLLIVAFIVGGLKDKP